MNALKLVLLLALGAYAACSKINLPTDFSTVASGTRANLKANFDEIDTRADACFDSTDEVRARLSGYTGDFTITSLDNLRLRLDSDGSTTGKFIVMSSNLDSLFWVSEGYQAKLFGHLTIDSNLTVRKVTAADSLLGPSLTLSGLTASRLVATNAGKTAASVSDLTAWIAGTANQITSTSDGDGSLTLSLPSAVTFPGTVTSTGLLTASAGISITGGSGGVGRLYYNSGVDGIVLRANTGATNDFTLYSQDAGSLIANPTGTRNLTLGHSSGTTTFPGKAVGSDTIAAALGFRAGSAGATDAQLYRSGANMWTTPDSLTVAGRVAVTGSASIGGTIGTALTASRTVITDGSGNLSVNAETGTGSHVRATSPTLVTPTLGVASATSISLGNESFTYDEGTFTMTGTGFTSSPTGTARYTRVGTMVVLYIPAIQGVSNSLNLTYTGAPASIRPTRQQTVTFEAVVDNTTSYLTGFIDVATDGTLTLTPRASATTLGAFTSSGSKGISGLTITYSLL